MAQRVRGEIGAGIVINYLILCERASGANAEARHANEQKSRDRVAAELAQYSHGAQSIHEVPITRHIGTRQEFREFVEQLEDKDG